MEDVKLLEEYSSLFDQKGFLRKHKDPNAYDDMAQLASDLTTWSSGVFGHQRIKNGLAIIKQENGTTKIYGRSDNIGYNDLFSFISILHSNIYGPASIANAALKLIEKIKERPNNFFGQLYTGEDHPINEADRILAHFKEFLKKEYGFKDE